MPIDSTSGNSTGQLAEPGDHLVEQCVHRPTEMAVGLDDAVGKAMDRLQGHGAALHDAGHHSTAGRSDVDRGEDPARHDDSAQEAGGHTGVDRDQQTRRVAELVRGDRGDGVGDVLGKDLALEQRALGVELRRAGPQATP